MALRYTTGPQLLADIEPEPGQRYPTLEHIKARGAAVPIRRVFARASPI